MQLVLTKELFDFIYDECEKFREETWAGNDVDVQDVLYSFFHSTEDEFHLHTDWDEGEANDPFWNKEKNEHSAIVFLKEMVEKLKDLSR